MSNRRIVLVSRPIGQPTWSNFRLETVDAAAVGSKDLDGDVVKVRVLTLSIDPAMIGWMKPGKSYLPPVAIGEVMRANGIGQIVQANGDQFKIGDLVIGLFGLQQYFVCSAESAIKFMQKIDRSIAPHENFNVWLSALGTTGLTAYFGLLKIGKPCRGDTVVISGAAGATGSMVGQIAKRVGCGKVIGIAGSEEKCIRLVEQFGFDAAINYKSKETVEAQLSRLCPEGIDVFFDNVGGEILDAALANLRRNARIVICGAISQYNATKKVVGPSRYLNLLVHRATMGGFVVFDYVSEYAIARQQIAGWIQEGLIKYDVDQISTGLDGWIDALNMLFSGMNQGKLVLKVAEYETNIVGAANL